MITVAINGFGRIGRNFLRALLCNKTAENKLNVAIINIGCAQPDLIAGMFKHDTLMGTFPGKVSYSDGILTINDHQIAIIAELDPQEIEWKKYNVDWVVEASGQFTKRDEAELHLKSGAPYVLITAPAQGEDVAIIPGVNDSAFNPQKDKIVSLGSCTANAFITMLKVLSDTCGIIEGFMTTIHAYTNSQVLLDVEDSDPRRSRAAALNIIPTTTGASKMLKKVMPELDGKLKAVAIRVPVAKVSIIDLVFRTEQHLTPSQLNDYFKKASQGNMKGIVGYSDKPLVSSDYSGDNHSVVIDSLLTETQGSLGKVFGWYDNEWGYSMRLVDFLVSVS